MSLLKVKELEVAFPDGMGDCQAVQRVSFEIESGEIIGLVGESGSGKSTAVRAVMGLLPTHAKVSAAELTLDGADINDAAKHAKIRGRKIAMVFQDPSVYLNPTMKIGRQIVETIRTHQSCTRETARRQAVELLDTVGIRQAEKRMMQYPFELSGGMCQRVAIAIAVASNPRLIIADEPTSALDATVQRQILEVFRRLSEEMGIAILIVTHDLLVAAELCKRVLVMKSGRIVEQGSVEEIFYAPQESYTKELLKYQAKLKEAVKRIPKKEVILQVNQLERYYKTKGFLGKQTLEAVDGVSFELYKGEAFGLVGESGCGKTTLARLLSGIDKADKGELYFKGQRMERRGFFKKHRKEIQMIFQNPYASLDPRLTIAETLEEPLRIHGVKDKQERLKRVSEILTRVGLTPADGEKYPQAFSGGQRQRIGIARALILEPELVICDEPVSALDAAIRAQILKLLKSIQKERDLTYLLISHNLGVVRHVTERVGVMYLGTLVEKGNTEDVFSDPWHPYTKSLIESELEGDLAKTRHGHGILALDIGKRAQTDSTECLFAEQCGYRMERCRKERPSSYVFGTREVACFLYSKEHMKSRTAGYRMTTQI